MKAIFKILIVLIVLSGQAFAQTAYYGTDSSTYHSAKVTYSNLVTYSEQFDNAAWNKPQSTVTANTVVAPDGTTTADTMLETAVTNYHSVYVFVNVTSGTTYRMAVYAKAQNRSVIQIEGSSGAFGANAYASYDLANGALGAVGSSATASITSVGNGWYLCTLIAPATATTTSAFNIHTATTIGAALRESYLGVITNGVYLWGGHENATTSPADYLLTTSAAATLGPQCGKNTAQSLIDPHKCFSLLTYPILGANTITASALATDAVEEIREGILTRVVEGNYGATTIGGYIEKIKNYVANKMVKSGSTYTIYKNDESTTYATGTTNGAGRDPS